MPEPNSPAAGSQLWSIARKATTCLPHAWEHDQIFPRSCSINCSKLRRTSFATSLWPSVRTPGATIHIVVDDVTDQIRTKVAARSLQDAAAPGPEEFRNKWAPVESQKLSWKSQVEKLEAHAKAGHLKETVATLAQLSNLPTDFVERKIKDDHVEVLLILAKSIGLSWQSTKIILEFSAGQKSPCVQRDMSAILKSHLRA